MAVVKRAVDAVAARAPRVSLVLKADLRPGVTDALTSKVETVERYLRPAARLADRRAGMLLIPLAGIRWLGGGPWNPVPMRLPGTTPPVPPSSAR